MRAAAKAGQRRIVEFLLLSGDDLNQAEGPEGGCWFGCFFHVFGKY